MNLYKKFKARTITGILYKKGTINNVERIAFNIMLTKHYDGFGELEIINWFQNKGRKHLRKFHRTDRETAYAYLAGAYDFRANIKERAYNHIIPLIERSFHKP